MKMKMMSAGALVVLLAGAGVWATQSQNGAPSDPPAGAQEMSGMPEMPSPTKEHEWLKKFVGEWESTMKATPPGMDPIESTGTETVRAVGDFWVISDARGDFGGMPFAGVMTLGYDPEEKHYTGTWVDSMTSFMWTYEGTINEAGDTLTLETEGKMPDGSRCRFHDVHRFVNDDHRVFTSKMLMPDGQWVTMMTIDHRRK